MQISKTVASMMNAQIGHELGASHQYLQIATYFDNLAFKKLAGFFYKQSAEEREHAMKFVHFLTETGVPVEVPAIPAPKSEVGSAEAAFQMSLEWEKEVTHQIHAMVEQAAKDKDYASHSFLQWFIDEQVEEISSMETMLEVVKRAGEKHLLMVEAYLIHEEA